MSKRRPRLHVLLLLSATTWSLVACQPLETRISEVKAERVETGELVVHFKSDQDLLNQGPCPFGYLRIRDKTQMKAREGHGPDWNSATELQELPSSIGQVQADSKKYVYRCQFPVRADRAGNHYYSDQHGRRSFALVECPYDLSNPGDHLLEFHVLGGGSGVFSRGLVSDVVTLKYSAP